MLSVSSEQLDGAVCVQLRPADFDSDGLLKHSAGFSLLEEAVPGRLSSSFVRLEWYKISLELI